MSWQDAKSYIAWLNKKTPEGAFNDRDGPYYLPSEAQWEYAARTRQQTERWWGDEIGQNNADCQGCGSVWDNLRTAPVGSFPANPFGLYDVQGNVWQLTEDCWHKDYEGAPPDGDAWTSGDCKKRVWRGGGWSTSAWYLRSAERSKSDPDKQYSYVGFRLARRLP